MSNFVVGLMAGLGVGAYVYNVIYKNTGGNTTSAVLVGGIVGVIAMVAMMTLLAVLF